MVSFRSLVLAGAVLLPVAANAANDDDTICRLYADLGVAGLMYLSELSPEQLLTLMEGKDARAAQAMGAHLEQSLHPSAAKLLANAKIDFQALGTAASNAAFVLAISGEAESLEDTSDTMLATCLKVGPRKIVANHKAATKGR